MSDKLNPKQERFCQEYLIDLCATDAALRAGYSGKTAYSHGARLLKHGGVSKRIEALKKKRADKLEITADWVLRELLNIFNADLADIIDPEHNSLRPVHDWPEVWRKLCPAISIEELYEGYGADRHRIGELVKIKASDKAKWIKMIGDHVDIAAFAHNLKVSGQIELVDKVKTAQERVLEKRQTMMEQIEESKN